jgi:hypothetical protein
MPFDAIWLQWAQKLNSNVAGQPMIDECKVEENPAYTYHGS